MATAKAAGSVCLLSHGVSLLRRQPHLQCARRLFSCLSASGLPISNGYQQQKHRITAAAAAAAFNFSSRHRALSSMDNQTAMYTSIVGTQVAQKKVTVVCPKSMQIQEQPLLCLQGYTLLVFYPLDFTFVCPTELVAHSDRAEDFTKLNCKVLGVSCDSEYTHLAWIQQPRTQGGLGPDFKIPLVADRNHDLCKQFRCWVPDQGFPLRASVLIDPKGRVRASTVYDTGIGRSVDETLRLIEACQFHDAHGEVCPANFTVASRKVGLKPDPSAAKEYFAKQ